jgi:hypothetical protein
MRRDSSREGKVWPARGNQRLEVKQLAIDALPHGLCFLTVAVGAAHVHPSDRCPGSTVVWVNEHSHIYHFPGARDYGHTKSGAYMCEAEAQTSGNRAAMNERHP